MIFRRKNIDKDLAPLVGPDGMSITNKFGEHYKSGICKLDSPKSSGRLYMEFKVSGSVFSDAYVIGITSEETNVDGNMFGDSNSRSWWRASGLSPNPFAYKNVDKMKDGDIIQMAVDIERGWLWFGKNGEWLRGSPGDTIYPLMIDINEIDGPIVPAVQVKADRAKIEILKSLQYDIPKNFLHWV